MDVATAKLVQTLTSNKVLVSACGGGRGRSWLEPIDGGDQAHTPKAFVQRAAGQSIGTTRTPSDEAGPPSGRLGQRDRSGYDEPVPYRILESAPAAQSTMSVADAAVALRIPRSSAYAAVARGAIPCIRLGRHIVVPRAAVDRLLEENRRAPDKR